MIEEKGTSKCLGGDILIKLSKLSVRMGIMFKKDCC